MNPWWLTVPVFLLLVAVWLMTLHARAWRALHQREWEPNEREYRWRQVRRRMQTSAMLMVLAIILAATQWLMRPPWLFLTLVALILVLLVWVTLLALADIWATKHYYGRIRHQCLLEEVKLQAELRRLQAARHTGGGNGKLGQHPRPEAGDKRPDATNGS